MSITTRVLLDPARLPSARVWGREIRAQGFAMDFAVDFDPTSHSAFLSCIHQGQPAGFEYYLEPNPELSAELRRVAGSERTVEITFVTHSDMRELVTAMIASSVLALLADGVVWSDESGEHLSAADAIQLARETEAAEI